LPVLQARAATAYPYHMTEKEIILEGVFRAEALQYVRDLAGRSPGLHLLVGPAVAPAYLEDVGIERDDEPARLDEIPEAEVYVVLSYHPAGVKVPSFERARMRLFREKKDQTVVSLGQFLSGGPQGLPELPFVVVPDHPADPVVSLDNPTEGFEEVHYVRPFLEPVVEVTERGKIAASHKGVGSAFHTAEEIAEETGDRLHPAIGEL